MRPTPLQLHEAAIQRRPDHYTCVLFLGRAHYIRNQASTFEEAFGIAKAVYRKQFEFPERMARPVGIYAVRGLLQSHLMNVNSESEEVRMAYLLVWNGYLKGVDLTVYVDKSTATEALKNAPETTGMVVETETDVIGSLAMLKDLYNALVPADQAMQQARTKGDAQARVYRKLEELARGLPVMSAPVASAAEEPKAEAAAAPEAENEETTMPRTAKDKKVKTLKVKKEPDAPRTRIDKTKVISVLVENPKRKGSLSYDRFKLYKDGMTVEKYLEKGGRAPDLAYDAEHKYIKLSAA